MRKRNKNRSGYKKTEIGWIPEDWDCVSFYTEFNRISHPVNVKKDNEYREIGIRSHGKGIFYKEPIKGKALGNKRVFWVQPNVLIFNIVFAWEQAVAVTSQKEKGFIASHRFPMYVSKNGKCDEQFVLYFFKTKQGKFVLELASPGGAGRNKTLGQDELKYLYIPLPPLPEQKKIADILSTWDKAIDKTEQLIEMKQKLKKGLMQQLLTGKMRFKEFGKPIDHHKTHKTYEKNKGTLLNEWREMRLGDVFNERNETGYNNLTLLSITGNRGVIPFNDTEKKDSSNDDKSKYKRILPGDIGYNTMRMWQGRSALSSLEGIVSPAYTICTPKESIDGLFASFLFKSYFMIHQFYRNSQGLTSDTWNLKYHNFSKIKIKLPPLKEQKHIASVLYIADEEIKLLKNKLNALKQQKKGLMQKLLTGEVRVKV